MKNRDDLNFLSNLVEHDKARARHHKFVCARHPGDSTGFGKHRQPLDGAPNVSDYTPRSRWIVSRDKVMNGFKV